MIAAGILSAISSGESRMMRRVNRWPAPRWIRLWMICATRGGEGWLWYAIGFVILMFGGRLRFMALTAASLAAGAGIALYLVLKRSVGRERPCGLEEHCWASLTPPDPFSFPSGHSVTAFAVALSLGLFYPSLLPGLLFCALSIAASRIVLGMHYLSDVVVGSCLGTILGCVGFRLFCLDCVA